MATFPGTSMADTLTGSAADDLIFGYQGADRISGLTGADLIYGNQDADLVYGNQNNDTLYGGQGNDSLYGGQDDDRLFGNLGNDVLYGNRGADIVYGNQGADIVYGNQGNDVLYGGQDADTLYGGQGDDTLFGGVGDDVLYGNLGTDTVVLAGERSDYVVTRNNDGSFNLVGATGTTRATSVEFFGFADGRVAADNLIPVEGPGSGPAPNRRPVANPDTLTATEDTAATYTQAQLLGNDRDPDGGRLRIASLIVGTGGAVQQNSDGTITFTPTANFNGAANFSYTISDGQGGVSNPARVTVNVAAVNDAPVANPDMNTYQEDSNQPVTGNVLINDTDPDNVSPTAGNAGLTVSNPNTFDKTYGTLTINRDGSYTYTPKNIEPTDNGIGGFRSGPYTDQVSYTVIDAGGATSTSTLTITTIPVNDAPVAVADTSNSPGAVEAKVQNYQESARNGTGNVLANDTDVDVGDTLTVRGVAAGTSQAALSANVGMRVVGRYGTLILMSGGSYTYDVTFPETEEEAAAGPGDQALQDLRALPEGGTLNDTFSYTVQDAAGAFATTTLTVTTEGSNDQPITAIDINTLDINGRDSVNGNILTNDSDPDSGDVLSVQSIRSQSNNGQIFTFSSANADTTLIRGQYGSLTLDRNGGYTYAIDRTNPAVSGLQNNQSLSESFDYTAIDNFGAVSVTDASGNGTLLNISINNS